MKEKYRIRFSLLSIIGMSLILLTSCRKESEKGVIADIDGSIDFVFKPGNSSNQIVLWVEDWNGKYIGTVFLTNFIGRYGGGNRTSNPNIDLTDGNRLSALPVWSFKRGVIDKTFGINNYYPPAETKPSYPDDIDAISGATPANSTQRKSWQLSNLPYGNYSCWIEVNRSYDFNDYHNYSYYRGQPSVVWNTTIHVTENPDSSIVFDYAGYGSPYGSDGSINKPDSTITTATDLLDDLGDYKFKVIYTPQEVLAIENNYALSPQVHLCLLNQNYPNPFNSSTLISYSILKSDLVILKIYNILGEEVQTLVNKFHEIGDYNVNFITNNLSNGFYFYQLRLGSDFIDTKMMLLIH